MTESKICRRSLPAKEVTTLGEPLPPQQSVFSAKTNVSTPFQPPTGSDCARLCAQDLPFDISDALTWCVLLGHEPWGSETHIRAIPRKGLNGPAINGNLEMDCESFAGWQAEGKGIYAVVNPGGTTKENITSCVALFVEWDDISLADQISKPAELGLPDPTFRSYTGKRSVHTWWTLDHPIEPARWTPLMDRLIGHCASDSNCKGVARCMRLPGGWHIDQEGIVGERSNIIDITDKRYPASVFEKLLPRQSQTQDRHLPRKVISGPSATLSDIGKALDHIPARVAGQGEYSLHR